jgi:tRNA dimethylallyltransferase
LYIDALIKNYDLTLSKVRNDKFTDLTNKELYEKLEEKNKQLAEKITINNRQRLIRALQILEDSNSLNSKKKEKYDYVLVQCDMSRNDLYKRINYRVEKMLELG